MQLNIAVLAGDGIGPEVTNEAIKVLNAVAARFGHDFTYSHALLGACAIDKYNEPLPQDTLNTCLAADAVLLGAVGHPKYDNNPDAPVRPEQGLLAIRKALNLFANIRPITIYNKLIPHSPLKADRIAGVDISIYRELTGGIYFGQKSLSEDKTVASDLCSYSVQEIEQIAHMAFKAAQNRRKKVTLVDKANVLETSRLWRRVVTQISGEYPDVALDFLFVDNAAMQLILNPKQFDVMLTENMFGDILSDEASVIGGSIGLAASASVGDKYSLFEPIHGSYPAATGKGIANPVASILSAALLLEHFGLYTEGAAIKEAVTTSIEQDYCTTDINPDSTYSTSDVGSYIERLVQGNEAFTNTANVSIGKSTII
ncbi:3-isopropylmalate dehydrogenase [Flavobacterium akiainvivens]|uniref:3-isopropylmalate dehydrogenase n=1 Tax=Flavobacterium akiainvivens TaxID=1202724 RepID=A0A0M8M7C4_9FLAO|nr:3-isopropylmalate dehydrogenase [Flavobacterium akiainvivens]KOS04893.1 3-isopropylmalate dehydrogenase [Flavobacterium akiainvivens]SFQ42646.1 3-isopropylmalate dehydrogenase [Flavobacterium akiainvivens]